MNSAARARQGFTLIEIVVAVFIVGLIMGGIGLGVMRYMDIAKRKTVGNELRTLKDAIEMYNLTCGEYPKTLEDLVVRPTDERIAPKWVNFLNQDHISKDPYGHEYIYMLTPGGEHEFELYSEGADKKTQTSVWKL
jgi:general secretion pathway protein G